MKRLYFSQWIGGVAVALVISVPAIGSASGPAEGRASLTYERTQSAEDCPSERNLRDRVAARLGYDPFREQSGRRVRVELRSKSGSPGYRARIELRSNGRSDPGVRQLETADANCTQFTRTLAFTVSVVIAPSAVGRVRMRAPRDARRAVMAGVLRVHDAVDRGVSTQSAAARAQREKSESKSVPPEGDESSSEPANPVEILGTLGGGIAVGTAPTPSPMARLSVEVARSRWAVRLWGRTEWPTRSEVGAGLLVTSLNVGGVDLCGRLQSMFACGSAAIGQLRLSGDNLEDENSVGRLYAASGASMGVDIRLSRRLSARLQGRLYTTLVRTEAIVSDTVVWTTPPISGFLSTALRFDF